MGRSHIQPLLGGRVYPAALNTPARKNQRMLAILVDYGKFQIAIERRIRGSLPHH